MTYGPYASIGLFLAQNSFN